MNHVLIAYGPRAAGIRLPGAEQATDQLLVRSDHPDAVASDDQYTAVVGGPARGGVSAAGVLIDAERWFVRDEQSEWHGSVAVYDHRTGRLVVRRDRIGFTHVYHTELSDLGLVGTDLDEVAAVAAHLGADQGLDDEAIAAYLTFQYVPAPRTIRRGIRQLLPGAALVYQSHRAAHELPADPWPQPQRDDGEPAEVVALVRSSLSRQLDPARPVAALISGGVDTSTNAVLLATALAGDLTEQPTGFTAAFAEPEYDETPYANAVCARLGLPHRVLTIGPEYEPAVDQLASLLSTPHGDRALFAQHVLFGLVRDAGFTQVVTGEGGDELLGYPRMRDGHEDLPHLPTDPEQLAGWYLERTCLASRSIRGELLPAFGVDPDLGVRVLAEHYAGWLGHEPFERLLYGQWMTWLPDGVLVKDTEAARWHRLDPVVPFASAALAAEVAALTPDAKRTWLHDKGLLRPLLARQLPTKVINKPKHRFWLPFAEWFHGPWRELVYGTLTDRASGVVAMLDGSVLRRLLAEHDAGIDHSRLLWGLVVLARWEQAHQTAVRPGTAAQVRL